MRQIAWLSTVIVATAMLLVSLWHFRQIVVIFLLSLVLAAVLRPPIQWLIRRGLPRWAALALTFAGGSVGVLLLTYFSITAVIQDLEQAGRDLATSYEYIHTHWPTGSALQQAISARLPPLEKVPQSLADIPLTSALQQLLGISLGLFEQGANLLVILVLSIYWSANYHHFERLWLSLLPIDKRIWARQLWRRMESEVGLYMGSEILQSVVAGVLLAVLLSLLGFPYPVIVSILAALAWLIPWIGPALALTAIWFATFLDFTDTTTTAAITRGVFGSTLTLMVLLSLEFFVEPRLLGHHRYSPFLIALAALAMAELVGVIGLILGPPLAVVIQLLLEQYFWPLPNESPSLAGVDLPSLQVRLTKLRAQIDTKHTVPMSNILERVATLLNEAEMVLSTSSGSALPTHKPDVGPEPADSAKAEREPPSNCS